MARFNSEKFSKFSTEQRRLHFKLCRTAWTKSRQLRRAKRKLQRAARKLNRK